MEAFFGKRNINTFTWACTRAFPPFSLSGTVESLHVFLFFGALQGHDISFRLTFYFLIDGDAATVKCKMIFMYLLPRKGKKKNKGEREFFSDKTEIRTRLLLIKD